MTVFALFLIALALAMDAFAVALTEGVRTQKVTLGMTLRMAGVFGAFQFVMPVVGWFLGIRAHAYIEAYDHWLAFGLLAFVGGRMLKEAWEARGTRRSSEYEFSKDSSRGWTLLVLGLATSLDALAVGLSFAVLNLPVWGPSLLIGAVCFVLTASGLHMGGVLCRVPRFSNMGNSANAFGGVVLLVIGIKILYEHGVFA